MEVFINTIDNKPDLEKNNIVQYVAEQVALVKERFILSAASHYVTKILWTAEWQGIYLSTRWIKDRVRLVISPDEEVVMIGGNAIAKIWLDYDTGEESVISVMLMIKYKFEQGSFNIISAEDYKRWMKGQPIYNNNEQDSDAG